MMGEQKEKYEERRLARNAEIEFMKKIMEEVIEHKGKPMHELMDHLLGKMGEMEEKVKAKWEEHIQKWEQKWEEIKVERGFGGGEINSLENRGEE